MIGRCLCKRQEKLFAIILCRITIQVRLCHFYNSQCVLCDFLTLPNNSSTAIKAVSAVAYGMNEMKSPKADFILGRDEKAFLKLQ